MEFINGLKISDIDGMKKMGLDIKDVGLRIFLNLRILLFLLLLFLNLG
jgi:predicted unusual protein kinase regulating ubiquinone biosynthesis (AarF/ABC1/UbiB family)